MKRDIKGFKRYIILPIILMSFLIFPKTVIATSIVDGYQYTVSGNTAKITDYSGAGGNIIIPKTISDGVNTYTVTAIGNRAFEGGINLTSVTIPDSVTIIDDYAFYGCVSLKSVSIPNSVKTIDYRAFQDCIGLTNLTIPSSVATIGMYAFAGCSGLESVIINSGVTEIVYGAFVNCTGITKVNIPSSVTSIEDATFSGCSSLTEINVDIENTQYLSLEGVLYDKAKAILLKYPEGKTNTDFIIPSGVTNIYNDAFRYCVSLTSVIIPDSVHTIGYRSFWKCAGLQSIVIPNSVTSINGSAFSRCTSLKSITIPSSVIGIGDSAFYGCTGLTSLIIKEGVTNIGESAFLGCTSITSVTIPNSITSISNRVFYNCSGLENVIIPNSVTSIGNQAFSNCGHLTGITIPDSVKNIGSSAFSSTWLAEATFLGDAPSMGADVFEYCLSGFRAYYLNDKTGYTESWYGYQTMQINYTPTYDINGGTGTTPTGIINSYVSTINLPTKGDISRTGFNFTGWNTSMIRIVGTHYNEGDSYTTAVKNITLYAEWTINNYNITFNSNGGSAVENQLVNYNEKATKPKEPTMTGYTFDGWYKEAGFINTWDFMTDIVVDTILYAKWTPTPTMQRLAGLNRIETSIVIAKELYSDSAPDAVVLATASDFADALAGSGLAYKNNAPLLLVNKRVSNSKNVLDYITTNLSKDKIIYILGGTGAVSSDISDYLIEKGYEIIRLGGRDRYETNQKIVDRLSIPKGTSIVIATGSSFADALSISSIASIKGYPILLNGKENLLTGVRSSIANIQPTTVYLIGGTGVLSANIVSQIEKIDININIVRLGGVNRYETSMRIMENFNLTTNTITIATGKDFPDALSGSVLAARVNSSVLLVDNKDVTKQKELLTRQKITDIIVLGGEGVISSNIANSLIQK